MDLIFKPNSAGILNATFVGGPHLLDQETLKNEKNTI